MAAPRIFLTSEPAALTAQYIGGLFMSTTQYDPQGYVEFPALIIATTADVVNRYGDYYNQAFNITTPRPASLAAGSVDVLAVVTWPSKLPYNGHFAAGEWTINVGNRWVAGRSSPLGETMTMHLRAQLWAAPNLLLTNAPYRQVSPVEIGNPVVFTRAQGVGLFPVTFNLDQISMHNEYLILVVAYRLDSVLVNAIGGQDTFNPVLDGTSYIDTPNFVPAGLPESCDLPGIRAAERYSYITPAGQEYPLDVPKRRVVISSEGEGLPPINYITQRGPFQDGSTLIDEFLQPRIVQLIVRHNYRSRNAYQAGRQALVAVLNPHLQLSEGGQQPGTLRKYLMSGDQRDLACMPLQGPNFAPRGTEWQEWSYQEALRFQGFDPVYTNPVQHTQAFAGQGSELVGEITGPIIGTTLDSMATINYEGTWKSYPTFTVLGPAAAVHIHNHTTEEHLFINYPLPIGETMTISLEPGAKALTLSDGTNVIGYLSTDSDLSSWHLTEGNDGSNVLHAWASGVNSQSLVTVYWYDKYLGI